MNYVDCQWQVGEDEPRAIYAIISVKDHADRPMIGVMDDPRLALEVVSTHNSRLNRLASRSSYRQKEEIIENLERVLGLWEKNGNNLEGAILEAFGQSNNSRRLYDSIGFSATVLGPNAEMPQVIQHAIDQIRNS